LIHRLTVPQTPVLYGAVSLYFLWLASKTKLGIADPAINAGQFMSWPVIHDPRLMTGD